MNAVLDVAIGLMLMYLILSLLCTTLNEFVSGLVNLRSQTLQSALEQLIDDQNLRALFYNHGLIDGAKVAASAGKVKPTAAPQAPPAGAPVPAPAPDGNWVQRVLKNTHHPAYLASKDVAMALIGSLGTTKDAPIPAIAKVEDAVKSLPDCNIRDVLLGCLAEAGNDIEKLRDRLAGWFDGAMDRLSGAYRRYLQWISFAVGLLVAIAFNADTFHVAEVLWQNPTLAGVLAQNGANFVAANPDLSNPVLPTDATCTMPSAPATSTQTQTYRLCLLDRQAMAFPIGWSAWPVWSPALLWQVLGLLATGIALSMGAPFWFDVLSKFVNLRGTGTKPAPVGS